jgi:cytosine/adenosine deaminase-related metal-dependent hydrolase
MEGQIGTVQPGRAADLLVIDGDPLQDIKILQDKTRIREVIARGRRIDLITPIPERKVSPGEQVRFLAACPLTQSLAFSDDQLRAFSRV